MILDMSSNRRSKIYTAVWTNNSGQVLLNSIDDLVIHIFTWKLKYEL